MKPETVERLVRYASRAPSGDNAQPWKFVYRPEASALSVEIDESRVDSPKSIWRFIARLSCGAALENLHRAAPGLGVTLSAAASREGELARVTLEEGPAEGPDGLDLLERRMTNRKIYSGEPLPPETARRLAGAASSSTFWITDRERIHALAKLMYRMDAAMYGVRLVWKSIESRIRFDRPFEEAVEVGLSRGSLELSRLKLWGIRAFGRVPHGLLRGLGIVKAFSRRTLDLVRSASGLCYLVSDEDGPEADLRAGRAVQCAWLALAREEFSTHPMNTLALMEHALEHGEPELRALLERTRLRRWIRDFRVLVPEAGGRRSVFLMRFGHAPPTARNGRLPLGQVYSQTAC